MKKKVLNIFMTAAMISMLGSTFAVADTFDAEANAKAWVEFDEQDAVHYFRTYGTIDDYDFEEFIRSEFSKPMLERMQRFTAYPDEMDSEVLSYWEEQGLIKELHDADDDAKKWASYVPVSSKQEENTDKKYPVIFILHGNENPIYLTEAYGYTDLAAKNELIAVAPWASNEDTIVEEIPRIMEELKENYPIDESRIYCVGFSKGAVGTMVAASHYPELFAAVAPGGCHPSLFAGGSADSEMFKTMFIPADSEVWESQTKLPIINLYGTCDQGPVEVGDELYTLNHFLNTAGCKEVTDEVIEAGLKSDDAAKQVAGIDFDTTETRVLEGTNYYIGDLVDENEISMYRMVRIEGLGHWPSGEFANIAWEYMSQFSRDIETGDLVIE